jgi:hypothetical protein
MELAPGPVGPEKSAASVTPLAPERFALQLTIGGATQEKLVRAQALLRHQVPSGDLAEVVDRALDALLDKVEARKFGKARPRAAVAASRSRGPVEERMRAALGALARIDASRGRGARSQEPGGDAARGSAALPAEAGP